MERLEWSTTPQLWIGDGGFLQEPGMYWGAAVVELLSAPALCPGETTAESASSYRRLATRLVRTLRIWENRAGLEIRYVWDNTNGQRQVRILLVARALGPDADAGRELAGKILKGITSLFPGGYEFGPTQGYLPNVIPTWAEIERAEEIRAPSPFVPPNLASYYYLIYPLAGDGSGWPSLPRALADARDPGFLSVALLPTRMTDLEREAIDRVCTLAQFLSEPQQDYDYFGNPRTMPADAAARDVLAAWQRFRNHVGVLARVGVAASERDLPRLTSLIGSVISDSADS